MLMFLMKWFQVKEWPFFTCGLFQSPTATMQKLSLEIQRADKARMHSWRSQCLPLSWALPVHGGKVSAGLSCQSPSVPSVRAVGEQSWAFPEHSMDNGCEQPQDEAAQTGSPLTQIPPKMPLFVTLGSTAIMPKHRDKWDLALYFQAVIYLYLPFHPLQLWYRAGLSKWGWRKAPSDGQVWAKLLQEMQIIREGLNPNTVLCSVC